MTKPKKIALTAIFIASMIVLSRVLSIRTPIITIGFSFVPIMLASIILGPKHTIFIAVISDIIGATFFPSGSYFLGFTLSAFLEGIIFGFGLYRPQFKIDLNFIIRLIITSLLVSIFINGILNTLWIMIMTKWASNIVLPIRIIKQLIMVPVRVITILALAKIFEERIGSLVND
ncbi:MAG: folate family ECF transporter S component [Bacilli bacterium]|nr:folate family ECF transporter S component [Bacilli bacterium]